MNSLYNRMNMLKNGIHSLYRYPEITKETYDEYNKYNETSRKGPELDKAVKHIIENKIYKEINSYLELSNVSKIEIRNKNQQIESNSITSPSGLYSFIKKNIKDISNQSYEIKLYDKDQKELDIKFIPGYNKETQKIPSNKVKPLTHESIGDEQIPLLENRFRNR